MGEVIYLKFPKKSDDELMKLCHLADDIDAVIKHYISDEQVDLRDLTGVLSHRLGTLLNKLDSKDELWELCEGVLKKQAQLKKTP